MENLKRLTIGVLGAANIARQFVAAVADSQLIEVVAVASRTIEKSRQFADELNVKGSYGSYEALLAAPNIDAIYVPLPNTLHAAWVIKALEAGKHVLGEKPAAITAADTRWMFDAAERTGLHLARYSLDHHFVIEPGEAKRPEPPITGKASGERPVQAVLQRTQ
jgi:D-xylose 1-dehydrogenase (NADP+, D-xylono-1,5-lactone-forming)